MDNKFYIYIYFDQRKPGRYVYGKYVFDYEPFYVGKGSGSRIEKHLTESKMFRINKNKCNKIRDIINETKTNPLAFKYVEFLFEKEAYLLETDIIKTIGRIDLKTGPLTNKNDGGHGGKNSGNLSPESRKKLGDFTRGKTYEEIWGLEKAERLKEIIRNNNKTRPVSQATRDKMSDRGMVWEVISPQGVSFVVKSLTKFCKKNNLTLTLMHHVAINKQTHHKGWKCKRISVPKKINHS